MYAYAAFHTAAPQRTESELAYRAVRGAAWAILAKTATAHGVWRCVRKRGGEHAHARWHLFAMVLATLWLVVVAETLYVALLVVKRGGTTTRGATAWRTDPNLEPAMANDTDSWAGYYRTDVPANEAQLAIALVVFADLSDAAFMSLLMLTATGYDITATSVRAIHLVALFGVAAVYFFASVYVDIGSATNPNEPATTLFNVAFWLVLVSYVGMWFFVFETSGKQAERMAWALPAAMRARQRAASLQEVDNAWAVREPPSSDGGHAQQAADGMSPVVLTPPLSPGSQAHAASSRADTQGSECEPTHADVVSAQKKHRLLRTFSVSVTIYAVSSIMAIFVPAWLSVGAPGDKADAQDGSYEMTEEEYQLRLAHEAAAVYGTTPSDIVDIIQNGVFFVMMIGLAVLFRLRPDSPYLLMNDDAEAIAADLSTDLGVVEMQPIPPPTTETVVVSVDGGTAPAPALAAATHPHST